MSNDTYAAFQSPTYYGTPNRMTVWDALERLEQAELDEAMESMPRDTFLELEGIDETGAYAMEIRSYAL